MTDWTNYYVPSNVTQGEIERVAEFLRVRGMSNLKQIWAGLDMDKDTVTFCLEMLMQRKIVGLTQERPQRFYLK
jgi:hypothetical protein